MNGSNKPAVPHTRRWNWALRLLKLLFFLLLAAVGLVGAMVAFDASVSAVFGIALLGLILGLLSFFGIG